MQVTEQESERKEVEAAKTLDAKTAYEVISEEGESELSRSTDRQPDRCVPVRLALGRLAVVAPRVHIALGDPAREALQFDGPTTLLHAVFAGWLIALMVWMLPAVKGGRLGIIVLMTYLVGLGGFAHIVAGATEVFYAAVRGEAAWRAALIGYLAPTLIGNIFGGVTLVAALNHAQATNGEN